MVPPLKIAGADTAIRTPMSVCTKGGAGPADRAFALIVGLTTIARTGGTAHAVPHRSRVGKSRSVLYTLG